MSLLSRQRSTGDEVSGPVLPGGAVGRPRVSRWPEIALGLVLAIGLVLRFVAPSALWLDEAQSVAIARLPLPDLFAALRQDGSPPLYYLLLHGWMQAFGTGSVAVRALSGLCSVLTLPLAWWLGRRLGGRPVAFVLLVLLATSPFALRYATETRMYALLVLLTVLGGLAVLAAVRRSGGWPVLAVGLVTAALLLTHYWSFFLVAVVGAIALVALRRHAAAAGRVLAGLALGVLAFVPWAPSFAVQLAHTGTPWATQDGLVGVTLAVGAWSGGNPSAARLLAFGLVLLAALGLFAAPASYAVRPAVPSAQRPAVPPAVRPAELRVVLNLRGRRAAWILLALSLGTLLVAVVASLVSGTGMSGRYSSVAFIPFLALCALGIAALPTARGRAGTLVVVVALSLAALLPSLVTPRTQAGAVAAALGAAVPGDVVAFCPDQLGPAVARLAPAGLDLVGYPLLTPAARVDWTDYRERNTEADPAVVAHRLLALAAGRDIWLVTSPGYAVPSDDDCRALAVALAEVRGEADLLVARRSSVFESERLQHFPAVPAG